VLVYDENGLPISRSTCVGARGAPGFGRPISSISVRRRTIRSGHLFVDFGAGTNASAGVFFERREGRASDDRHPNRAFTFSPRAAQPLRGRERLRRLASGDLGQPGRFVLTNVLRPGGSHHLRQHEPAGSIPLTMRWRTAGSIGTNEAAYFVIHGCAFRPASRRTPDGSGNVDLVTMPPACPCLGRRDHELSVHRPDGFTLLCHQWLE